MVCNRREKAIRIVSDLYRQFMDDYRALPEDWQERVLAAGGPDNKKTHARVVADYIAGITDRFAIREHEKLFEVYQDMR